MMERFQTYLHDLPTEGLHRYASHPLDFRTEAVEAALAELERRGLGLPEAEVAALRQRLAARDAARHGVGAGARWLGEDPATRRHRARAGTALILVLGLGTAAILHRTSAPPAPSPTGFEPEDSKKYLRQMEMIGGKANVVGAQFTRWFDGLWQGRGLARTVAVLTLASAGLFWVAARPRPDEGPEP